MRPGGRDTGGCRKRIGERQKGRGTERKRDTREERQICIKRDRWKTRGNIDREEESQEGRKTQGKSETREVRHGGRGIRWKKDTREGLREERHEGREKRGKIDTKKGDSREESL